MDELDPEFRRLQSGGPPEGLRMLGRSALPYLFDPSESLEENANGPFFHK